jgi:aquaporin Z
VLTIAYALGAVSGAHLNPAVSIGLTLARRFPAQDLLPYIAAQLAGAMAAAGVLYAIASGRPEFSIEGGFAANGFGAHSPAGYSMGAAFAAEAILTAFFVTIILGAIHESAPVGFAPIAIGLALTLIHLVGIPITNTSVNPARSLGPALVVGDWALDQLWLFWIAPVVGAAVAGLIYSALVHPAPEAVTGGEERV